MLQSISIPQRSASDIDPLLFIKYLYKRLEKFGVATKNFKNGIKKDGDTLRHFTLKSKILEEISSKYGISVYAILHSTKRGAITKARVMAFILFQKHLEMSDRQIAYIFGKKRQLISQRIKSFANTVKNKKNNSINSFEKIYTDKEFIKRLAEVDRKIKAYNSCLK